MVRILFFLSARETSPCPTTLFGSPATSLEEARGFASPPYDEFAFLAVPLREDALALFRTLATNDKDVKGSTAIIQTFRVPVHNFPQLSLRLQRVVGCCTVASEELNGRSGRK